MKMKQSGVSAGLVRLLVNNGAAKTPTGEVSAGLNRDSITNSLAKKLNIFLISLALVGASGSYADCPTVKSIQNSKDRFVISDDGSIWSSDTILQEVRIGTVFSKAIGIGVEIEDEDDRPLQFQSLSTISCEYKINATSEIKGLDGENKSCVFTLRPAPALKVNQCQIIKPKRDPKSPWILNVDATKGLYKKIVAYECVPNPKTNLVTECPFSFDTYN